MTGRLTHVWVGDVRLTKIVERRAVPRSAHELITGLDVADVPTYLREADPTTVEAGTGAVLIGFHSWLLQASGWTALIDPAVGNGKQRPTIDYLNDWNTDYLDVLARAGVGVDDVDVVISTHHHVDHVGWNTRWDGESWRPTFPSAEYVWSALEFGTFDARHRAGEQVNHGAHVDSVLPIREAGLATLVGSDRLDGHEVRPGLTLASASGHTAGTMLIRLRDGDERAVFAGDCLHHPGQVPCADLGNHADADPRAAARVRARLLQECADTGALLVPGHFTGTGCGHVRREGSRLQFAPAAPEEGSR